LFFCLCFLSDPKKAKAAMLAALQSAKAKAKGKAAMLAALQRKTKAKGKAAMLAALQNSDQG
jgi:hypothetical protein